MASEADRIAALEREVAELKAKAPREPKDPRDIERENAEWIDQMHQMREGRMALATPPSVVRDMAGGVTSADMQDILKASHAPKGPSGMGKG